MKSETMDEVSIGNNKNLRSGKMEESTMQNDEKKSNTNPKRKIRLINNHERQTCL